MSGKLLSTQPYKGTRDFYPEDERIQQWMFSKMREVVASFGYQPYNGPMLEPFELYAAKTGEEIVNQQLYWMMDRGERKMAVRPEMTPTLARMVAGQLNELAKPIRWYSIPNLWRYERPQRGRLREHWQLNVDVLGGDPLLADAEILSVALNLMKSFGGETRVSIRVNHRKLMDDFFKSELGLNTESALKLTQALDARAKVGEDVFSKWLGEMGVSVAQSGKMENFFKCSLGEVAKKYPSQGADDLLKLFSYMKESGFENQVLFDPLVLRGLDYYTGTVFEIYDTSPENRRAMFGGGRYDNLIGLFGKNQLSGVGFGMGDVTLRNFLETHSLLPKLEAAVDVFVSLPKIELREAAEKIAHSLRESGLCVTTPLEASGFGAQLKMASKQGARFAVLLGDAEFAKGRAVLKDLTATTQREVEISKLAEEIKR